MENKLGSEYAFPQPNQAHPGNSSPGDGPGMSYRQYLAAHAPKVAEWWLEKMGMPIGCTHGHPPGCSEEVERTGWLKSNTIFLGMWPWAYADMVLEAEHIQEEKK